MNNEVRNNTYFIRERDVDNDFNEYSNGTIFERVKLGLRSRLIDQLLL